MNNCEDIIKKIVIIYHEREKEEIGNVEEVKASEEFCKKMDLLINQSTNNNYAKKED